MADANACKPTTRLHIVCPEVAVLGAGMLVTHGLIAAETLPQAVAICEGALAAGRTIPAILRMVTHTGRRTYVVPQLDIVGVRLADLEPEAVPALPTTEAPALAPAAPSPPANPGDVAALRERIATLDNDGRAELGKAWVGANIPPLGRNDFTVSDMAHAVALLDDAMSAQVERGPATSLDAEEARPRDPAPSAAPPHDDLLLRDVMREGTPPPFTDADATLAGLGWMQAFRRECRTGGLVSDDARGQVIYDGTGGRTRNISAVLLTEVDAVQAALRATVAALEPTP